MATDIDLGSDVPDLSRYEALLADTAFWDRYRERLVAAALPVFTGVFRAGAQAGMRVLLGDTGAVVKQLPQSNISPARFFASLTELSEDAIYSYTYRWAEQIGQSTYRQIQDAVVQARREGRTVHWVTRQLRDLFGPERAQVIAVTETTRLFGVGAQATYEVMGAQGWQWQTVADELVCPLCAPRNGREYPMSVTFEPAHPRCRCFNLPVVEITTTASPVRPMQVAA